MCVHRLALAAPILLALAPTANAAFPEASFQARVSSEDYLEFCRGLDAARVNPDKIRAASPVAYATEVESVDAGGAADGAGVGPHWLAVSIDGAPCWDAGHPLWKLTEERKRTIAFITPDGTKEERTFEPGPLGIERASYARPEVFVLEQTPPGAWTRHVLVAHFAWEMGRHDITESSLFWAAKAGMPPNALSTYWGSMLALDRGQIDESWRLTRALVGTLTEDGELPVYFLPGLRTLGLAHHDWELLKHTLAVDAFRPDAARPDELRYWADRQLGDSADLLAAARRKAGDDRIEEAVDLRDHPSGTFKVKRVRDLDEGECADYVKPGRSDTFYFTIPDGLGNVLVSFDAWIGSTGPPRESSPNVFQVDLVDTVGIFGVSDGRPRATSVIEMLLSENPSGTRTMTFSGGPSPCRITTQRILPWLTEKETEDCIRKIDGDLNHWPRLEDPMHIDMVRLDEEAGIFVNGKPMVHLPVQPAVDKVGIHLNLTGCVYRLENFAVHPIK